MKDSRLLSIPEVAGKTLVEACIYQVDPEGRELLLRFSDSTQLSIEVGKAFAVDVLFFKDGVPDQPIRHMELH